MNIRKVIPLDMSIKQSSSNMYVTHKRPGNLVFPLCNLHRAVKMRKKERKKKERNGKSVLAYTNNRLSAAKNALLVRLLHGSLLS